MKWLYYTVLLLACCRMAGCGSDKDSVSVLPSDPPAPEEPEYVDPTAGFREVGPWGSMEDMIPDEHPDSEFSQCYYNYFCLCNKEQPYPDRSGFFKMEKYRWVFTTGNKIYP